MLGTMSPSFPLLFVDGPKIDDENNCNIGA